VSSSGHRHRRLWSQLKQQAPLLHCLEVLDQFQSSEIDPAPLACLRLVRGFLFSPAGPAIVEATSRAATIMAATGPSSPLFFRYYGSDPPWKDEPTNVEVLKGLPKTWITKRVRIFKNEGITTGYYRKKKQSVPKSSNLLKPMQDFKPKIKPLLGKKELLVPEVPTVRTSNIFLQHGNDHDEGWEMEDEIDWFFSDSEDIVTSDRASPLDQNQAMMLKLRLWNHTARNGPKWLIIQFKLSIRLTPEN